MVAVSTALAACTSRGPDGFATASNGWCQPSRLVWTIVAFDGTTPFVPPELRVEQKLSLEMSTVAIGCSVAPFTAAWTSSSPQVARVTALGTGRYADLVGVGPGTTLVRVELVDSEGQRGTATREFRVF